ncbi:MAG: hypothetical protein FWH29_04905 [Methanobrevibacter sp.]|nr:hypothetical protein [Methanobrevibacter sp.]
MIKDEINFKTIVNHKSLDVKLDIGIYHGNEHFLLIMVGIGGDIFGNNRKYEKIATRFNKDYGYTVIVSSTPPSSYLHSEDSFDEIMKYVNSYATLNSFKNYDIILMGNSGGGTLAGWYSYKIAKIKKLLIINPVLMLNFHRMKKGLKEFDGEFAFVIFGQLDSSVKYSPLLENINPKVKIIVLEGIDHEFSNNEKVFLNLSNYLIDL